MKSFEWNENGICTNANIWFKAGGYPLPYRIEVRTARTPKGRWVYGISADHNTGGFGCGCWIDDKETFDTEEEAALCCLEKIRRYYDEQIAWYGNGIDPDGTKRETHKNVCRKAIAIIDGRLAECRKPKQLELFG